MVTHKIALISDIHFGIKSNSEVFLKIIEDFFTKTLICCLKNNNITDVRILGDLFDNRNNLNVRTINVVTDIFNWYNNNHPSIKFKILTGNHDIYYHNRIDINSIKILSQFPNVQIIDKVYEETILNKKIIMFPWLVRDSESDIKFKTIKNGIEKYDLCLGHFEVNGFEVANGITHDGGLNLSDFFNYNKVISGHFHLRRTNSHISYLGCPYQLMWSDCGDDKGIHIVSISDSEETIKTTFVKNIDSPEHLIISVDDILNRDISKINRIKGNFIKLLIDKKYEDTTITKLISKIESYEPLRLEVENNYIEQFDGENVEVSSEIKTSDPLSFLLEYIKQLDLNNVDNTIDKTEFSKYVSTLYSME